MNTVVLIGFMGSGKTAVGRALARVTGWDFIDTDQQIEAAAGMSIPEVFAKRGEAFFRDLESQAIFELAGRDRLVVATGGGAVLRPENAALLKGIGPIVYLGATEETLLPRLEKEQASRPLLAGDDLRGRLREMLAQREGCYRDAADRILYTDGKDVESIAAEILAILRAEENKPPKNVPDLGVDVNLPGHTYRIHFGQGILDRAGRLLTEHFPAQKVLVVTNPTVRGLWGRRLEESLRSAGFQPLWGMVPDGEGYKSMEQALRLLDLAVAERLERQTPLLAFGGGVIGDLAGLVAALYQRGMPLVQIPTTLLAQVDSSIGGKVAVNHPQGKNLLGTFYHPRLVLADPHVFTTLPSREVRNGMAEVIKYGVIRDPALFALLETHMEEILALEPQVLMEVLAQSCRIKAAIVEADEKEAGERALLNYGHTIGHALETLAGYGEFRHGEAVAIGMIGAARLAEALGYLPPGLAERQTALLQRACLPTAYPLGLDPQAIYRLLFHDKKVQGAKLRFVLPTAIGQAEIFEDIPEKLILKVLSALQKN